MAANNHQSDDKNPKSPVEGQIGHFSSDGDSDGNKNKKVWNNKPSNGGGVVVEAAAAVSPPVMGAVSWPALGEAVYPKSSESLDAPLLPALQLASGSLSPTTHKKKGANNVHTTSSPNHKHKSMKRGGGSFNSNGGASHVASTKQDLVVENFQNSSGKPATAGSESSPRDNAHVEPRRGGFGSQSHNANDNQHQQRPYRRSNSGQHSRGDGSNHHGNGGKRDQEWNQHSRSFNGRDTHMHPQRGYARGYVRPSVHTTAPFIAQPMPMPMPVRSFGNNMIYSDLPSPVFYVQGPPPPPEALRAMPMVGPVLPPIYFAAPGQDQLLSARIVSQVDYYFSNENLVRDTYLRKNMDEEGWVPVSLIAGFNKVSELTKNSQLILEAMKASNIVEVQGDKIRRRNDWMRWLIKPAGQYSNLSSPQAVGRSPSEEVLASQLQNVTLNNEQHAGDEETGHVTGQ